MRKSISFLLLLCFCISCTKRPVAPTRESRRTIDTLYQQQIFALQSTMDSLCKIYIDSFYQAAVDSMLHDRMQEMNELVK